MAEARAEEEDERLREPGGARRRVAGIGRASVKLEKWYNVSFIISCWWYNVTMKKKSDVVNLPVLYFRFMNLSRTVEYCCHYTVKQNIDFSLL